MAKDIMAFMTTIILVQLFFATSITMITYSLPNAADNQAEQYLGITTRINVQTVSEDLKGGLEEQTNVPIIELGALVFYSGNILIDLLLNFIFATKS
jgi:hypothetical protein